MTPVQFLRHVAITAFVTSQLLPLAAGAAPDDDARRGVQALSDGNLPDAMRWLRKSANEGSTLGMTRLDEILDTAEEDVEARTWFEKASALGDRAAMFGLGRMMASGEGGARNLPGSVSWLRRSAEAGEPRAMQMLAAAYRAGDLGLARDPVLAADWERRLAETAPRAPAPPAGAPRAATGRVSK